MKLTEIQEEWRKDANIDRTELGEESLRIPQLHAKYYNFYSTERLRLKSLEGEYRKLYKAKYEYYNGTMCEEDLRSWEWEPFALKILKSDISVYLEGDNDLITAQSTIDVQKEKVEFLESAIKSLTNRGFQIKSAIDWVKFTQGA